MVESTNNSLTTEIKQIIKDKNRVRICQKDTLDVIEAAAYTGIGIVKLEKLSNAPGCDYVVFLGSQRLFIRTKLEKFLESQTYL